MTYTGVLIRWPRKPAVQGVTERPYVHRRLALACSEPHCDALYEADGGLCPACGSEYGWPLERWLNRDTRDPRGEGA